MRIPVLVALLSAHALVSGIPAFAQTPASNYNVTSQIRPSADGMGSVLSVTNGSGESIVVTSVTLYDCENIQGSCTTRRLNIRLAAGVEAVILRVRPRFEGQSTSFRSRFSWTLERPAGNPPPRPVPVPAPVPSARTGGDTVGSPVARPAEMGDARVRTLIEDAIVADSANDQVIDTVIANPAMVAIRAGADTAVGDVITVGARNALGQQLRGARVRVRIEVGEEYARVQSGRLVGVKPGSAVLVIEPPRPPNTSGGEPKGATRVLIRVLP